MKITIAIDTEKKVHPSELIDELIKHLSEMKGEDRINSQVGELKDTGSYIAMQRDWPHPLITRNNKS